MNNNIEFRVVQLLSEQLGTLAGDIKPETNLIDDLHIDSLDGVEIVMELEDEFDIQIPDDDFPQIATVGQIVDYVKRKVNSAE